MEYILFQTCSAEQNIHVVYYITLLYSTVRYNAVSSVSIDNDPDNYVSSLPHIGTFYCSVYYSALHNEQRTALTFKNSYKCCSSKNKDK